LTLAWPPVSFLRAVCNFLHHTRGHDVRGAARFVTGPIRVLVAEDNFFVRLGRVTYLRDQPQVEVVGAAPDRERTLALFEETRPDILLLDLRLDGVALTATLQSDVPGPAILVLSGDSDDQDIFQALRAGARGYLTSRSTGEQLLEAIQTVHAGGRYPPPQTRQAFANRDDIPPLTPRERQVLEAVADGASNREIGESLGIATRTVGLFVSSILAKLGARSRTEAVAIAQREGLLRPPGLSTPPASR
jgi:DNA-binding NarL/FixJ family response regulator